MAPAPVPRRSRGGRRKSRSTVWVALALLLIAGAGIGWRYQRQRRDLRIPIRQVTFNDGIARDPSVSPDGKTVVFSADWASTGSFDLWLQDTSATRRVVRLTQGPFEASDPDFSPDGAAVAFAASGAAEGIYVIQVRGGKPRRIIPTGMSPRWSPDGKRIAYWREENGRRVVEVAAAGGGDVVAIAPGFAQAAYPCWSEDGSRILFWGAPKDADGAFDWYVAAAGGSGQPRPTGAFARLRSVKLMRPNERLRIPGVWKDGEVLFATGATRYRQHIWSLPVDDDGAAAGDADRLSYGGTIVHAHPRATVAGAIYFSSAATRIDFWNLPLDADNARLSGAPQPVGIDAAVEGYALLNRAGERLMYAWDREANENIAALELARAQPIPMISGPNDERLQSMSADGTRIVYAAAEGLREVLYVASTNGGSPLKVCEECVAVLNSKGDQVIYASRAARSSVAVLGVDTGVRDRMSQSEDLRTLLTRYARFSPDDAWIAIPRPAAGGRKGSIAIHPFRDDRIATEGVEITGPDEDAYSPAWAPNGNLLYFVSNRDGYRCLWAQLLSPGTRRPVGPPAAIQHFHDLDRAARLSYVTVARNAAVVSVTRETSSVWMRPSKLD